MSDRSIIKFNHYNDINLYRITSNLIPLLNLKDVKISLSKYKEDFLEIGKLINQYHMRVGIHIDPFYVLNSRSRSVVMNTISVCKIYQKMFKLMHIDGYMIFHVGGGIDNKEDGIKRFIDNFKLMDSDIKKIIILENDDKLYNVEDTLYICEKLSIPMCLDYHHYNCNKLKDINALFKDILNTCIKRGIKPKIHFSSPKNKREMRAHNDYIDVSEFMNFLTFLSKYKVDVDVMLEAKKKDEALFKLLRELKYHGYHIEGVKIYLN